jgi:hypothetical protein
MTLLKSETLFSKPYEYLEIIKEAAKEGTLRKLISIVEDYSENYRIFLEEEEIYHDHTVRDMVNTYKGDFLELFAEVFFTCFNANPAIGLTAYTPIGVQDDYGVDATAINANGDLVAVQVKYRANPMDKISYEDLAKTYTAGTIINKVSACKPNTLYLFTTAYEVSYQAEYVLDRILVLVNRKVIEHFIDNNLTFWEFAVSSVDETIKTRMQLNQMKTIDLTKEYSTNEND